MARTFVIGAGIIGATTALYLARAGEDVTLFDSQAEAGLETSFANAGLLSPNSCGPWSSPGTPAVLLKWLGREDVPLTLRPRAIPGLGLWGLQFVANCRAGKYQSSSEIMTRLAHRSFEEMESLLETHLVDAQIWRGGHLEVFRGEGASLKAEQAMKFLLGLGGSVEFLDAEGCLAREPSLEPIRQEIRAGLWLKDEAWGDARRFAAASGVAAAALGATFRRGCTIDRIEVSGGAARAVHTNGERLAADRIVICAGPYSAKLLRPFGVRLPIAPVKGYSMTLMKEEIGFLPELPVIDELEHIAVTPLGDRLRIGGTVEFDGFNTAIDPGRITNLKKAVKALYPQMKLPSNVNAWCGMRPMTSDGLPYIDATAVTGLFINTGHGACGWTLACGSAELMAGIVTGRTSPASSPFRLNRSVW